MTLVQQRDALGPVEVTSPAQSARANRVDKYLLAKDGLPIHGVGVRVRVAGASDEVIDPLRLGDAARSASPDPRITADTAVARAVAARSEAPSPRGEPPSLAYDAILTGRTIERLLLTWRVPVIDRADRTLANVIVVIDAETGDVLRHELASSDGTAIGHGAWGTYTLPVESTLPFGIPATDGSVCLADLTRGVNITNSNPCGPLALGIHTFIDLPPDVSHFAETIRVIDTDGVFGDGAYIQTLARAEAEGERGRSNASDAHHSLGKAYDFFHMLGRDVLGVNQSLRIRVNSFENPGNAAFYFASGLVLVGTQLSTSPPGQPPNNHGAIAPATTVEYLTHEYTHGVLYAEIGAPEEDSQFGAIHEGVGDVFGVLADAWSGGATIDPPSTWNWADDTYGATNGRVFDRPSRQGDGWDAVTTENLWELVTGTTSVHKAGGVIRRMFYFLANGAVAAPTTAQNTSTYLPAGMSGIGVDPAGRVLWRAISDHISPGAHPTFLDFRDAMVAAAGSAEFGGACSPTQKATMDAWAAVNVGAKADRVAPDLTYTLSNSGGNAHIAVRIFPQPGETPTITARIDALSPQPIALQYASGLNAWIYCGGPACFFGSVDIPVAGQGMHELELEAVDGCANVTATSEKFEFDPPSGLSVIDRNWFRSSLRVFRLTAYDSSSTLSYGLQVGTLVMQGTLSSGLATDVNFDLSSLPGGTTMLTFWVRDQTGNETVYTQPYYIDRTPPYRCTRDAVDLPEGGGFTIAAFGCEAETSLEILDVWINGAPWWWVDRNQSGERGMTMTSSECGNFRRAFQGPYGVYALDIRCVDAWGNVNGEIRDFTYTTPPSVSATVSTNATAGTFKISASASSALSDILQIVYKDEQGTTLEADLCPGFSTSCSQTFTASQPAGSTRTYRVRGIDAEWRSTDRTVTVVMPMPPPPPTTYTEVENNDRPQTANVPPRTTTRIDGRIEYSDVDGVCAHTSQEYWASCALTQPWNCKHECGDYFGFDLAPGQSLTYQASVTFHACFKFTTDYQLNVGETISLPAPFTSTTVSNGTRVTNTSSSTRRLFVTAKHKFNTACAATAQTSYSFTIVPPP